MSRKLADLIEQQDYPQEVADQIRQDIEEKKTGERIVSGELTLPHRIDAIKHFDRISGRNAEQRSQDARDKRLLELESRLANLEGGGQP